MREPLGNLDETTLPSDLPAGKPSVAGAGAEDAAPSEAEDLNLGRRVGPYRLERLIARGGMGAVYLATREDDFEQRVALKLVHPELQTVEVLRRFAGERQILANLQHPGIARILDGGTTDDALPYFVMEYVDGERVDRYCDHHELPLRRRLELFLLVCEAVHFAHQNLIVHRDLKPGNILVTAGGEPVLLDFGIAKVFDEEFMWADTRDGEGLLTPAYASPEQLLGEPVTTASDVFSLGVLLYLLVSGRLPFPEKDGGVQRRMMMHAGLDPDPPSVAAAREIGERRARRLEGDVDAIVRKALRVDPAERYASALQLAQDIGRHLADFPVAAHPPSWSYRAGKLARRHKLALTFALLVAGFAIVATVLWRQAVAQRNVAELAQARAEVARLRAESAQTRAETVRQFLEDLFESADPDAARGAELTLREALDQGRAKLAGELEEAPEIRADLLATLGTVYQKQGHYETARELKEEALSLRLAASAEDRQALAVDLNNLGSLLSNLGEHEAAAKHLRRALGIWERLGHRADTALVLRNLAAVASQQEDGAGARELYERALAIDRELYGDDDPRVVANLYGLGAQYRLAGDPERAEPLLRRALELYTQDLGGEHTKVASVASSLALVLHSRGRLEEARELLERALATRLRLLGEDHVRVATARKNLAALLLDLGEIEEAGELIESARVTLRRETPPVAARRADAESVWGAWLAASGRRAEAGAVLRSSYETLLELEGEGDLRTRAARRRLESFEGG